MKVRKGVQWPGVAVVMVALLCGVARASMGDHLPEFRECVRVCTEANCGEGKAVDIRMFVLFFLNFTTMFLMILGVGDKKGK